MILSQQQYTATRKKLKMLEDSLSAPRREGVPEEFVQAALAQTRRIGSISSEATIRIVYSRLATDGITRSGSRCV